MTHIPRRRRAQIAEQHVPHQLTRSLLLRNSRDAGGTHGGKLDDNFAIFRPGKVWTPYRMRDHPDGALTHLRCELAGCLVILRGSNLSRSGASDKPGAVHSPAVIALYEVLRG
jgi:hypothetical protein